MALALDVSFSTASLSWEPHFWSFIRKWPVSGRERLSGVPSDLPFLPSWFSGKSPPSMKGNMKLIYWAHHITEIQHKFLASKPSRRNFWSRDWSQHREFVSCGIQRYVKNWGIVGIPFRFYGNIITAIGILHPIICCVSVTNLKSQWLHLTHSNRSTITGLQRAKGKTCGRTCVDIINIINCPLLEHPKMFCIKMCNDLSRQRSTLPMPSQ